MKIPRSFITAGALTALSFSLAAPAFGQGQMQQSEQQQTQTQQSSSTEQAIRASDLTGSRVVNSEGDRLGTVDDLAVELENGVFSYAIISAGGFLGIGGELHPVPPEALQTREVDMGLEVVLDISNEEWDNAPTIEREQVHMLAQETRGQEVYEFYGQDWQARQQQVMEFASPPQQREDQPQQPESEPSEPESQQPMSTSGEPSAQIQQIEQQLNQAMTQAGVDEQQAQQESQRLAQQFAQEQPSQEEIQNQLEQALTQAGVDQQRAQQEAQELSGQLQRQIEFAAPPSERQPGSIPPPHGVMTPPIRETEQTESGEEGSDRFAFEGEELRPANEINLASDLMGATLENQDQQEIGHISDFLLTPQDGRLAFALLTPESNFWEMTDEEYAVSPRAFEVSEDKLTLNVTQQDLEMAQLLTPSQLQGQLEQLSDIPVNQARQSPQVFRFEDRETGPGVFGSPDRQQREPAEETPETPDVPQSSSGQSPSEPQGTEPLSQPQQQ